MRRMIDISVATAVMLAATLPIATGHTSPSRLGQGPAAQDTGSAHFGDEQEEGAVVLIDAHPYRHCHYIHTRVYCHKRESLPMNWPPNTDTPHGSTYENPSRPPPSVKNRHAS